MMMLITDYYHNDDTANDNDAEYDKHTDKDDNDN